MTTAVQDWRDLDHFPFGDGPALADQLLALILEGKKTATCWAKAEGLKGTEVGKRWVVEDGKGRPRAVLQTIELTERRFDEVDAAFAYEEGEDERALQAWRREHEIYFTRNGGFAPDMPLYCERFRLIQVLNPGEDA